MPKASLLNLPQEVHDNLCRHFTLIRDFTSLRLASKQLNKKTERAFIERQFTEVEVDLTEEKLQYLVKVSKSEKYSNEVRTVVIEPRRTKGNESLDVIHPRIPLCNTPREQVEPGDVAALAQALQRFKNLACIQVAQYKDSRHFHNHRVLLRPVKFVPSAPTRQQQQCTTLSSAFAVVIQALQRAGTTGIKTLNAGGRPKSSAERRSVGHLALALPQPKSIELAIGRRTGLCSLEHLHLVLEISPGTYDGWGFNSETLLCDFLAETPNLKSLRLEFWASSAEWLSTTLTTLTFPHLKTLHLEATHNVRATHLQGFIARHAGTLRTLALVNLTFTDDNLLAAFPLIFQTPTPLRLTFIRLQQICAKRAGLLLFDGQGVDTTCEPCKQDMYAAWRNEPGPICPHGNLVVTTGELEAGRELVASLGHPRILPWVMLRNLCF